MVKSPGRCRSCCRPRLNYTDDDCAEKFCDQDCVENGTVTEAGVEWTEVYTIPEMLLGYFGVLLGSDNTTLEDIELFYGGSSTWESDTFIAPSPCIAVVLEGYDYGEIEARLTIDMVVAGTDANEITLTFSYQVFIGEGDGAFYEWEFKNVREVQDGLCSFLVKQTGFTDDTNYPVATYGGGWCADDIDCMCVVPRRDSELGNQCSDDDIRSIVGSALIIEPMTVSLDSSTICSGADFAEAQTEAAEDFNHTQLLGSVNCDDIESFSVVFSPSACCWYACYRRNEVPPVPDCRTSPPIVVPSIESAINGRYDARVSITPSGGNMFTVQAIFDFSNWTNSNQQLCHGPVGATYSSGVISLATLSSGSVTLSGGVTTAAQSTWTFPATITITF